MCLLGCFCLVDRAEIASLAAERVCLPLEVKYGEVLILEIKENKLIMGFESPPPCPPYLLFGFGLMTFGGKVTSLKGQGLLSPRRGDTLLVIQKSVDESHFYSGLCTIIFVTGALATGINRCTSYDAAHSQ